MNGDTSAPPAAGSWIEIDASCLESNLDVLREHIGPAELCMVVKGHAYGHGYDAIVPIAEAAGIRRFAVFSAREAHGFLRASDGKSRLMVMGRTTAGNLPWLVEHGVEPWINDSNDWPLLRAEAERQERDVRVHLEVETGMNRTGLLPEDAVALAKEIDDHPRVHIEGVCTHFAGRESSENNERVEAQRARFDAVMAELASMGIHVPYRHASSSAAGILDEESRFEMCRVGIAAYGLWPSREVHEVMQRRKPGMVLRNVLQWKSQVVAIKDVADGEYIGYGKSYESEGDTRIAVIGVGYADGFARDLSNRGYVLIRGRRASIVGNVGMNMIQAHIGHMEDVEVGDEVVLIGRQGEREISVASFADFNSIVNYELMARLSHETPRLVVASHPVAPPLD